MTLTEAKKVVEKIHGQTVPFGYKNVWGFFPGTDTDDPAVFVSKDTSTAPLSGIFLDDNKHNGFINYETGEDVDPDLVFGEAFYEGNPNLFIDDTDPELPISERLDTVIAKVADLLIERGLHPAAMVMVYDIVEDEESTEETALRRLTVLKNYLGRLTTKLSMTDFSYLHHELYGID